MLSLVSEVVRGLLLWSVLSSALWAHDRTGFTTVRLIQRQGNLELIARIDLVRLLVLDLGQPGLDPREAALLEALPEAELKTRVEDLKKKIVSATHLRIGKVELKPERILFPSAAQLKLSAASFVESGHPDDSEVRFDSRTPVHGGEVSLAFDRFLGPVIITYSQPETRLLAAGTGTVFRNEVPSVERSSRTYGMIIFLILGGLGLSWLVHVQHKRLQPAKDIA